MIETRVMQTSDSGSDDVRWRSVLRRDRTADGSFFHGVRTTGIYCRPSCSSRTPRRGNVIFFDEPAQAEAAGFRPCRRCRPNASDPRNVREEAIRSACRILETAEEPPALAALARSAGLGPSRFQRLFKEIVGLSPRQVAIAARERRMDQALRGGVPVTQALYEEG